MIVRVWHGRIAIDKAKEYHEFVVRTGIADYHKTKGNLSARIIQQPEENVMHIWTVSHWKDYEAVKTFAGEDFQKAHYYPEDKDFLLEFEPHVHHHETENNLAHDHVLNALIQVYTGGGWYAECFMDKLKDINHANAFTKPLPSVHAVGEIVAHCIYWRRCAITRLKGDLVTKFSMKSPENWLPVETLKEKSWEKLFVELQQTQMEWIDQLLKTSGEILDQEYHPGYTLRFLIEGAIQHDIYHLGQIGLVKKMIS